MRGFGNPPLASRGVVVSGRWTIGCAQAVVARKVWSKTPSARANLRTAARTVENIETARRLGASGVILFSYDSLVQPPRGLDTLASIGRAAFTP